MSEIRGSFEYNNLVFQAGYRYGGHYQDQGGYGKCLRIYHANNGTLYPHDYFGDDKYEVASADIQSDKVILTMRFPLDREDEFLKGPTTIILKRT